MKTRKFLLCLAASAYLTLTLAAFAAERATVQLPRDLVREVVYNELRDRQEDTFWQYRIEKQLGAERFTAIQVDTRDGPIHRIVARDGRPLTADQQRVEEDRLANLMRHPAEQARVKQRHADDEHRLERLMKLMPDAFLYEFDGMDGGLERLRFRPDPAFDPPTYEARIFHALAGSIWIDPQQKRLARLKGSILDRVDFGYGLFGHVDKGGAFELKRQQVSATHWKSCLIDVHVTGRMILFATVSRDQTEVRSDFKPVPLETSLQKGREMLDHPQDAS